MQYEEVAGLFVVETDQDPAEVAREMEKIQKGNRLTLTEKVALHTALSAHLDGDDVKNAFDRIAEAVAHANNVLGVVETLLEGEGTIARVLDDGVLVIEDNRPGFQQDYQEHVRANNAGLGAVLVKHGVTAEAVLAGKVKEADLPDFFDLVEEARNLSDEEFESLHAQMLREAVKLVGGLPFDPGLN